MTHDKETVPELIETCSNQDVINDKIIDRKLTDFCRFGHITVNSDIFCQLFLTLDNFLSILCHLTCLDSDMFLSIRTLFPCGGTQCTLYLQQMCYITPT